MNEFVSVWHPQNQQEVAVIKMAFTQNDIHFHVTNEFGSRWAVGTFSFIGAASMEVLVWKDQVKDALRILKELGLEPE